jgi:glyoxylate reductase
MTQPLVAITRGVPTHDDAPPVIAGCRVKIAPDEPQMTRAQLLDFVRGATCVVTMFHDRVDAEFLDAAGPQLRGVCNFAVGVDNIDLKLCAARGVTVTNTPDAVTEGTANMAWALMLATARRLIEADAYARSGAWAKHGNGFPKGWMGMHLTGQTLLIVGAGRIGKAVALRGLAFGMRIAYVARSRKLEWELAPLAAQRVTLEEGLALADVVSVHTPLTEQTRHLLNEKNLKLIKPSAIVINTARGPVIDEAALAKVLREKKIWGAGLDVFEHEPKVHPELVGLSNVVMSPHIGSSERKYRVMMGEMACADAGAIARAERAVHIVRAEPTSA